MERNPTNTLTTSSSPSATFNFLFDFGKISSRFFAKSLLLSATLAIEAYFFYVFCIDYAQKQFETLSQDDFGGKIKISVEMILVLVLQLMSVMSLFALFFGNPGYVTDFFRSVKDDREGYYHIYRS